MIVYVPNYFDYLFLFDGVYGMKQRTLHIWNDFIVRVIVGPFSMTLNYRSAGGERVGQWPWWSIARIPSKRFSLKSISCNSTFRYSAIEKDSKFHFQFAFETTRNESMHIWSYAYAHAACSTYMQHENCLFFLSIFKSDDDKSLRPTQNDRNVLSSCWSVFVCVCSSPSNAFVENLILLHTIFCAETELALRVAQ